MDGDELAREATVESMRASIAQYGQPTPEEEHAHGGQGPASVREAEYLGHRIVIKTSYEIEIDGKPLRAHVGVDNGGMVHYHGIPNNRFRSAIDLVKHIIDAFPDDFPPRTGGTGGRAEPEGGHHH